MLEIKSILDKDLIKCEYILNHTTQRKVTYHFRNLIALLTFKGIMINFVLNISLRKIQFYTGKIQFWQEVDNWSKIPH